MEGYNNNINPIYQTYRNGGLNNAHHKTIHKTIHDEKPEIIYSDPEIVTNNANNEKYAVKVIMEKYDSLRCLNVQMDGLQVDSSVDGSSSRPDDDDDDDDMPSVHDAGELLEQDIAQVEVFFRSHKTHVSVCRCLANLYFATVDEKAASHKDLAAKDSAHSDWELARTGIPVLLLDKGDTKARNKRMLQIVLAEKGSGFVLWKDVIDNLTNYRAHDSTFHTMYLSSDHRRMAGLSFDGLEAAELFLAKVDELTSDPLNISLSVPKQKKKLKGAKKKEKVKQLRKCDISTPCRFEHVTSVALDDKKKLFSMATLVTPGEQAAS